MRFTLPARIAWRYLTGKKSHSGVGAVTAVAVCGVAAATAAIICVLSVFNGFQKILAERLSTLTPDVMVTSVRGKVIADPSAVIAKARSLGEPLRTATPTITDNALILSGGREMPVTLKGVEPESWREIVDMRGFLYGKGEFLLGAVPGEGRRVTSPSGDDFSEEAILDEALATEGDSGDEVQYIGVSVGVAAQTDISAGSGDVLLFAPSRTRSVNLANPSDSFESAETKVSAIFRTFQEDYDKNCVIADISVARRLFEYDKEATAVEIALRDPSHSAAFAEKLSAALGADYIVRDSLRQQEMNFRMIQIEKWITFLLLAFILLIAFFNVISSLSMLVIDKQENIVTMRMLGMSGRSAGAVFAWESVYVSLIGGVSGIVLGLLLCLAQMKWGLVKLNGDETTLLVTSYPVAIEWADPLMTLGLVTVIGLVTAFVTAAFARSRKSLR